MDCQPECEWSSQSYGSSLSLQDPHDDSPPPVGAELTRHCRAAEVPGPALGRDGGGRRQGEVCVTAPHSSPPSHPQITLPCVVQSKKGLLQWTKDGFGLGLLRELPGYPRYRMVGEEERGEWGLEINSVSSADDGVYQCQAE